MGALLKFLGKLGKGKATAFGIASLVAGVALGSDAAQQVVAVGDAVTNILTEGGTILAAFGVGRKAMDHAAKG